jgi:predicted Rossmann fold nucleotide-binding protein DprA/Smf involved in DNA uptake
MNKIANMPGATTLHDLLEGDARDSIRALTIRELREALANAGLMAAGETSSAAGAGGSPSIRVRAANPTAEDTGEAELYRRILAAITQEPLTIGQLSKRIDVDVDELRGYLNWMKKAGKVASTGRARATRYCVR